MKEKLVQLVDFLKSAALWIIKILLKAVKALVEEMNRYGETPQEVMKLLNTIPAECSGRVSRILVDDGANIEAGQPLMVVDIS